MQFALVVSALVVGHGLLTAEDWTGQRVVMKRAGVKVVPSVKGSPVLNNGEVAENCVTVLGEHNGHLRIRELGQERWFAKSEAVLVKDAADYFTDRLKTDATDADLYFRRGMARGEQGDLDRAVADLTEAIRLSPRTVLYYNSRGIVWRLKKEYDKAVADYTEAIRLSQPEHFPFAYYNRGKVWRALKEYDKAIADYSEAIRLGFYFSGAFNNRGLCWQDKGEIDKAIADFGEAIRLDSMDVAPLSNRARLYGIRGEYEKAITDATEAIRLDPKSAAAYETRAWVRATCPDAKYRDGARAVEDAKRACELNGWKSPADFRTLAAAYADCGQFEEAVKWQEKALDGGELVLQFGSIERRVLEEYRNKRTYPKAEK